MGFLHALRFAPVPRRDRDLVLGEVLRNQQDRRLLGQHHPDPDSVRLPGVRHSLLQVAGRPQVRDDRHRDPGAGDAEGANRAGRCRPQQGQWNEQFAIGRAYRVIITC